MKNLILNILGCSIIYCLVDCELFSPEFFSVILAATIFNIAGYVSTK